MKKYFFLAFFSCLLYSNDIIAQDDGHYIYCKVFESKNSVKVEFTPDVKYIGDNYEQLVMYDGNKRHSFMCGEDAVNYLSSVWGWSVKGNPIKVERGKLMWILQHKVDKNIVNFRRNLRALEEAQRRYGRQQRDDIYY